MYCTVAVLRDDHAAGGAAASSNSSGTWNELKQILDAAGVGAVFCNDIKDFQAAAAYAGSALLVAHRLGASSLTSQDALAVLDRLPCPFLIVTGENPDNLKHLARFRADRAILLPHELNAVPEIIRSIALPDGRTLLLEAIPSSLHATLSRALHRLFRWEPPGEPVTRSDAVAIPHSVGGLARSMAVSGDYLARLGTKAGIPIGTVVRRNLALRALELYARRVSPIDVALRLGYNSEDGPRKLVQRQFGSSPSTLLQAGLRPLYAETAALLNGAGVRDGV